MADLYELTVVDSASISVVLDRRDVDLFLAPLPAVMAARSISSDISDPVCLLSSFKLFLLRGLEDDAGSTTACKSFLCRLSEQSSSTARFRFRPVGGGDSARCLEAVDGC